MSTLPTALPLQVQEGSLTFPSPAKTPALTDSLTAPCQMLFIHVCWFVEYRFQQEIWQGHSDVSEFEVEAVVILILKELES